MTPGDRTYDYNVLPVVEAGRVVVVDMDHAVDDEVSLEPTPGHTAGHVAIRIRSCGEEAVFSGDLMHWPMQCIYPTGISGLTLIPTSRAGHAGPSWRHAPRTATSSSLRTSLCRPSAP
jgi:glyoxylase-like metal-dependent hydrolase (beta-lactamase superfamily II)